MGFGYTVVSVSGGSIAEARRDLSKGRGGRVVVCCFGYVVVSVYVSGGRILAQ